MNFLSVHSDSYNHGAGRSIFSKMYDVVELYLNAIEMYKIGEIVLSVHEKTSIQALGRKYPHKPTIAGRIELIEHEYKRHGTCCLTAGLEVATGQIMGMLTPNRVGIRDEVISELNSPPLFPPVNAFPRPRGLSRHDSVPDLCASSSL